MQQHRSKKCKIESEVTDPFLFFGSLCLSPRLGLHQLFQWRLSLPNADDSLRPLTNDQRCRAHRRSRTLERRVRKTNQMSSCSIREKNDSSSLFIASRVRSMQMFGRNERKTMASLLVGGCQMIGLFFNSLKKNETKPERKRKFIYNKTIECIIRRCFRFFVSFMSIR